MNVTKTITDKKAVLAIQGRLDTVTAPELESEVKALGEDINELVFDMSELEYVSSAGLRVILAAHKKMSSLGGLKLVSVCDIVMEVFEVTGFSDILVIE